MHDNLKQSIHTMYIFYLLLLLVSQIEFNKNQLKFSYLDFKKPNLGF